MLRGFDETDILPFGGTLDAADASTPRATVPLTFIPPFPTYPPETSWMREPKTDIPGLVLSQHGAGRVAFMPADIDRRYAAEHLPDHATLLANIVRWAAADRAAARRRRTGLIDCHLYEQPGRLILHLVNLTSEATWRAPLDELIRGRAVHREAADPASHAPAHRAAARLGRHATGDRAERDGRPDRRVDPGSRSGGGWLILVGARVPGCQGARVPGCQGAKVPARPGDSAARMARRPGGWASETMRSWPMEIG